MAGGVLPLTFMDDDGSAATSAHALAAKAVLCTSSR